MIVLQFLAILLSGVCFWQDWKQRAIAVWLPPLFAIVVIFQALSFVSLPVLLKIVGINALLLSLQLALVMAWFVLRQGRSGLKLTQKLGLGDILWLYALTPFLSPFHLVVFVLIVLFGSIIASLCLQQKTIPLAGYLAVGVVGICFIRIFTNFTGYDDFDILKYFQF